MGEGRWGRGEAGNGGGGGRWLELREQRASLAPPCAGFYLETRSCGWKHCPPFLLGTGSRAEDGKGLLIGQEDSFSWQKGKIPEYDSHHISSLP